MKGIKCVAPIFDLNGYAQWSRGYILGLIELGVPLTIFPVSFDAQGPKADLGEDGEILKRYVNKDIEYDTVITWLVPDISKKILAQEPKSVKRVNMSLWEADKLPDSWIVSFNELNEVWVCGEWNRKIYQKSIDNFYTENSQYKNLKNLKVKVVPYPANCSEFLEDVSMDIQDIVGDKADFTDYFKFYFISQWNERKNFADLLYAFWSEFTVDDKVLLILKTYISDQSSEDRDKVQNMLQHFNRSTGLKDLPPVLLLHGAFSTEQMVGIHNMCDCFVSPSRGEGLGLGIVEATLTGTPVICNTFGEQVSYIEGHLYTYNHSLRPVVGMTGWYNFTQNWASPDVKGMAKQMREVYCNPEDAVEVAQAGRDLLIKKFSRKATAECIVKHLGEK